MHWLPARWYRATVTTLDTIRVITVAVLFVSASAATAATFALVRVQRRERVNWATATATTVTAFMGGLLEAQHGQLSVQGEKHLMELGAHQLQMCMLTTGLDLRELLNPALAVRGEARGKSRPRGEETGKSG